MTLDCCLLSLSDVLKCAEVCCCLPFHTYLAIKLRPLPNSPQHPPILCTLRWRAKGVHGEWLVCGLAKDVHLTGGKREVIIRQVSVNEVRKMVHKKSKVLEQLRDDLWRKFQAPKAQNTMKQCGYVI